MKRFDKRGQVALFVILALVIVGGIVLVFVFRENLFGPRVSAEFRPVFDYYASCIENEARAAVDLAGSQGGRVYVGPYVPGSEYAPFSSQLNFLGFPVPYWFYISGNGLLKEDVPTKSEVEAEVSRYVEENLNERCNFEDFYEKGFSINLSEPSVAVKINDANFEVDVDSSMVVASEKGAASMNSQSVSIKSSFGKLYKTAVSVYSKERRGAFLENYSIDVLRTYAPVDGVELSCSGKVWKTREVMDELKQALEANVAAIKFEGDYYTPGKFNDYFVVDLPVEQQVNLLYSRTWPTKIEIWGADNELMSAEPVGVQEGLGVMGFCYAPYHFVYDISYPVLVQVMDGLEVFQFPIVVVVDKNRPREGIYSEIFVEEETLDACQYNTQDVTVNVYDTRLNRVDANLSLICFNQKCGLGSTTNGVFNGKAPACLNGYLKASAAGYAEKKQLFSTNEESFSDIILDREYEIELSLESAGSEITESAMVIFTGSRTVNAMLPEMRSVKLSEGFYNVSIYIYSNSSISIPGETKRQCNEVPKSGFGGFFGQTEQKCFDIAIPETKIESALVGGGKGEIYLLPSDLEDGELKLEAGSLPMPNSLEQLQSNYQLFEVLNVGVIG